MPGSTETCGAHVNNLPEENKRSARPRRLASMEYSGVDKQGAECRHGGEEGKLIITVRNMQTERDYLSLFCASSSIFMHQAKIKWFGLKQVLNTGIFLDTDF
ncbi:hypothetical protein AMECASPLE_029143 [Ameca splendens]|uniref:Uncharacterized protein n=1 Tax=Ameca splendens TaxID=208324 RepID=A0ABV0Y5L5_9TELE